MLTQLLADAGVLRDYLITEHSWILYCSPLLITLLLWRLYMFTIRPLLWPEEIEYLPYWIPVLGHAFSFFKNSDSLYKRGRTHFRESPLPFMLRVAGDDIAIVTSTKDAEHIYADKTSFAFDFFAELIYRSIGGVSNETIKILWRTPKEGFISLWPNPKEDVLVHTGNALLHKQMQQPELIKDLSEKALSNIEQRIRWDAFLPSSILSETPSVKAVSLHCWCRDVTIDAQNKAFFGDYLHKLSPDITSLFDQWDINSWMMTYSLPSPFNKKASVPRDKLIGILHQYLDAPREKRTGGVPFVEELQDECISGGLSHNDIARVLFIILWGVNSNVQMTTFWVMAYILRSPELLSSVRNEIAPFLSAISNQSDDSYSERLADIIRTHIINPASCPLLNSVFSEVLRICSTGSVVRKVVKKDVTISGKRIALGKKLLIPQRQFLLSHNAFGTDAYAFDPERFLKNRGLERHEYYRPFGGGITLCSGRFVGRMEVLGFVALAIWKYELRAVGNGEKIEGSLMRGMPFPRLDEAKPSLGVSKQVEGDDMVVEIIERKR